MPYIDRLIEIYGRHTIKEVDDKQILSKQFGEPLETLCTLPGFSSDQAFVQALKRSIEDDRDTYEAQGTLPSRQIAEALKALLRVAIYDDAPAAKIDTLRQLFLLIYADNWNWKPSERRHFEFVAGRFRAWNTYFLSYTNVGATIINDEYRGVIRKYTDPNIRRSRREDVDNILVDAMVHWLQRNKLSKRGFYDKARVEGGDSIPAEILPAIRDTLAFVQLIQLDSFENSEKKINWCFREYDEFRRSIEPQLAGQAASYRTAFESRYIPILAGERADLELPDYKLPENFRPWKKRIFEETHHLCLSAKKQRFDLVMKELEQAIIHRAYKIAETIPTE